MASGDGDTDGVRLSGDSDSHIHVPPYPIHKSITSIPLWAAVAIAILAILVLASIFINLLAVNSILVNDYIPGRQLCHFAESVSKINEAHHKGIEIPPACASARP
jgi:hypothetical protein